VRSPVSGSNNENVHSSSVSVGLVTRRSLLLVVQNDCSNGASICSVARAFDVARWVVVVRPSALVLR